MLDIINKKVYNYTIATRAYRTYSQNLNQLMDSPQSVQQQIVDLLLSNQKILIMASSPADGDCIGSALALYIALKKLGKEITVVCPDPIPDVYHFLPTMHVIGNRVVASKDFIITIDTKKIHSAQVKNIIEDGKINIIIMPENGRLSEQDVAFNYGPERYDLIITVDTGGLEQLGTLYSGNIEMFSQMPVINIDHHFSNDHFGKINYVDVMASATTELIIPLISMIADKSGQEIWDEDIATLLLTGIITDTGSFQNANTTPRAFDASAQLIGHGARQQEIIQHIFKTKQLTTLKLWGRILTKMQTDEAFHIVWSVLTQKDFTDTGASENETGGIIDELLSNAPGAEIICLIKEKKDGLVSGSIRTTNPSVDASAIAESFGGGGHTRAAGFKMQGVPVEKVEEQILKAFRDYQSKRLGVPLEGEQTISQPPIVPIKFKEELTKEQEKIEVKPEPKKTPKLELKLEPKKVEQPRVPEAPTPVIEEVVIPVTVPLAPEPTQPNPEPVAPPASEPEPAPDILPSRPSSSFNFQEPVEQKTESDLPQGTESTTEPKPETPYTFTAPQA